ncbi:MAG: LuxR C-terminal-related transcriptional regulator [Candidatus Woesearchaeota archaeon]
MLTRKEIQVLEFRKKNMTQVEIASKLNISQAAVSGFERSAYKKIKDAHKIIEESERLEVDIHDRY